MLTLVIQTPREPRAPDATRIYAIGDVHGRVDLLDGVIRELGAAAALAAPSGDRLIAVFLGDYIDRGPDSRGVIQHAIELRDAGLCDTIFLRGNHEQVLLDLLDGRETTTRWLEYGGRETLASYGVESLPPAHDVEGLRQLIAASLPQEHVAFLRETGMYVQLGDYLFVHAGLRPDRLLEEQAEADLLWFRYYDEETPVWSYTVVHGHSPNARPVLGRNRIAIDTEAYASGALTALRLQGEGRAFLKVARPAAGEPPVAEPWAKVDSSYQRQERSAPAEGAPPPGRSAAARADRKTSRRSPKPRYRRIAAGVIGLAALGAAGAGAFAIKGSSATDLAPTPGRSEVAIMVAPVAPPAERASAAVVAEAPPVSAAQEAASPAVEPTPAGPRAQVAAAPSREAAERVWAELTRKFPEPTRSKTLQLESVQLGGQTLHRALVAGFDDAAAAADFCRTLQSDGRGCLVRKPSTERQAVLQDSAGDRDRI